MSAIQSIQVELAKELEKQSLCIVDGKVSREAIRLHALKMDPELLSTVFQNEFLKAKFFVQAGESWIFDKISFEQLVFDKGFMPDSYTKYRSSIGLFDGREYTSESQEISLVWPFRDCVLEGGLAEDQQSRQEIFWNQTLAAEEITVLLSPKAFKSIEFHNTDESLSDFTQKNAVIRGNNLLALHSLKPKLGQSYDAVYIDPPYYFRQTKAGDTFAYNSNFKFSSWLTFMKNRLEVAKSLMKKDGLIFISISEDGLYHLKLVADEVFGADKFVANFVWEKKAGGGNDSTGVAVNHEYVLCYGEKKSIKKLPMTDEQKKRYKFEDSKVSQYGPYYTKNLNDKSLQDSKGLHYDITCPECGHVHRGQDNQWKCNESTFLTRLNDDRIVFRHLKGVCSVHYKLYLNETHKSEEVENGVLGSEKGVNPNSIIFNKIASNSKGKSDLVKHFPEGVDFPYPKPVALIQHLLSMMDNQNLRVLDFFAGSGTTGEAVIRLNHTDGGNRTFTLIEQLAYARSLTAERSLRAANSLEVALPIVYMELAESNENWMTKLGAAKDKLELRQIWESMKTVGPLSYKVQQTEVEKAMSDDNLGFEICRDLLFEALDKNLLYVPYSEMEDETFELDEISKQLTREFYGDNK